MNQFFDYIATSSHGETVSGRVSAETLAEAVRHLGERNLVPVKLDHAVVQRIDPQPLKPKQRSALYSQLSDLVRGGVPLLRSLSILRAEQDRSPLATALDDIHAAVANGASLSAAMSDVGPNFLPPSDLGVLRAGEEGGFLEDSLQRLSRFATQQEEFRRRVVGAIAYPAFLLFTGTVVIVLLLTVFVPRFAPMFDRLRDRGELPWATTLLLGLGNLFGSYWFILLTTVVLGGWGLWRWWNTEPGRWRVDGWLLKGRGIGPIVRNLDLARFCRVLGTMLQNSVPIVPSINTARTTLTNSLLSDAVERAAIHLTEGGTLATRLRQSGYFPNDLLEVIAIGEQSNQLDRVLLEAADRLEERTQARLDIMLRFLEPILLLLMAGVVLFIVLALQLPLMQMGDSIR